MDRNYDVIVVGAGGAGLCAALAARERGANVLVLEWAPEEQRGGNTHFTGGAYRFAYEGLDDVRTLIPDLTDAEAETIDVGKYTKDQFYDDLMRVTEDLSDPDLAYKLVGESLPTMQWLEKHGMRFVLLYGRQAFKVEGKLRFWGGLIMEAVGGGAGLSERLFTLALAAGMDVRYQHRVIDLVMDAEDKVTGVVARGPEGTKEFRGKTVVLASGGFESNAAWRCKYLGPGWELARVRGTEYNNGDGIKMALGKGAQPWGHWSGCHAVAWDINAPPFGDREVADLFQKHSYPYGVVVNLEGKRFVDEGADFRNYTYAKYGREILKQPRRGALQIFDSKVVHMLRDEYKIRQITKAEGSTIGELADKLNKADVPVNKEQLEREIQEYNAAVQEGSYNPTILDGKRTQGLNVPKSNWALPIDSPPYLAFAVTCGITFTFGGLRINEDAQVLTPGGRPIPGLFACGELVGGLFYHNYPGGTGLTSGAVFGKIAGSSAAKECGVTV